ncbi:NUDIX domain-containing protein [Phytohabitans sp. LJ34]|uniref:NUDIX domain-containing protein n=1 Tax=Phytohabitans sp. LJ34 TaxID=3452217 RepID=UPI003F88BDE3
MQVSDPTYRAAVEGAAAERDRQPTVDVVPQVVMVAGGMGTRLSAKLPPGTPKILAGVQGRPFLAYVLALLATQGVRRLHMCLGVGADAVLDAVERHRPPDLCVTSTVEVEPLGTAGCLRAAAAMVEEEFILLLGDTYTPVDLRELVRRHRAIGTEASMAVLHNRDWLVPSNVAVAGDRVTVYDKQAGPGVFAYIDYGIAIMRRSVIVRIPHLFPVDLDVLFQSMIDSRDLGAVPVDHRFYEIGSPEGYAEFIRLVSTGTLPRLTPPASRSPGPPSPRDTPYRRPTKRRLDSRTVFRSDWMSVREDSIQLDDGSVSNFAVVSRADFVVVVCEFPDGRLLMTEQYRYAIGRWSLEFPQGAQGRDEDVVDAALRELREETGWIGAEARLLPGRFHEAGDWASHGFSLVQVVPAHRKQATPDASEAGLRTRLVSRRDLSAHIRSGLLSDAPTLAALAVTFDLTQTRSTTGEEVR